MFSLNEVSYLFFFLSNLFTSIVYSLDLVPSVLLWRRRVGCKLVNSVGIGSFMAAAGRLHAGEFGWDWSVYMAAAGRLQAGEIGAYRFIYGGIGKILYY